MDPAADRNPSISPILVVMNLGSPSGVEVADVRSYLREFLMDKRVISLPRLFRWILVHGLISRVRAPRSAAKYARLWDREAQAFPLITRGRQLASELATLMGTTVHCAMRYGSPSVEEVLGEIVRLEEGRPIILLPLYPHYAQSSYETAVVHFCQKALQFGVWERLRVLPPYFDHPLYIEALAQSIQPYLQEPFDRLVLSYHGIPIKHLPRGCDHANPAKCSPTALCASMCYRYHCARTTEQLCARLGLESHRVEHCYQSRLGHVPWLKPYFADRMRSLPLSGVRRIVVAAPGFAADCLETLIEVQEEGRDLFLRHNGVSFTYVPCLNDDRAFVRCLAELIHTARPVAELPLGLHFKK